MSEQIAEIIRDISELQSDLVGIGSEEIMDKLGRIRKASMALLQQDIRERILDTMKADAVDHLVRLVELADDSDLYLVPDHRLFVLQTAAELFAARVREYFESRNRQAAGRALDLADIPMQ